MSPSVGITLLDERGRVADTLAADAGLVAALRPDEGPPTWVVTGTDNSGVAAAVELIGEPLHDRYAVATISNGGPVGACRMPMRPPLAYRPGRSPLHPASPGVAVAFLGAFALIAFVFSSPLVLLADGIAVVLCGCAAGARRAVVAALRLASPDDR